MSIELKKDSVSLSNTLCDISGRILCESDIIVPDILPDIAHIVHTNITPIITESRVSEEGILTAGSIDINIIYLDDASVAHAINTRQTFSKMLESSGLSPDKNIIINTGTLLENLEHNLINSRKLTIKALVEINAYTTVIDEIELPTDLHDKDNYELKTSAVNIYSIRGMHTHSCNVRDALEVPAGKPPIYEILRMFIQPDKKEYTIAGSKIITKGSLIASVLYTSDTENKTIQYFEQELSFTEIVDSTLATDDSSCDLDYLIQTVSHTLREDNDGDTRAIVLDISLDIHAKLRNTKSINILTDTYSTMTNVSTSSQSLSVDTLVTKGAYQFPIKEALTIEPTLPEISQILNINAVPKLGEVKLEDEKILLRGEIKTELLYLADNPQNPIASYKTAIPFTQTLDIAGITSDMACEIKLSTLAVNSSAEMGYSAEFRCILSADVHVIKSHTMHYIDSMEESELQTSSSHENCAIKIYFVQKGDSLWDIAKHYKKKISDILSINDIDENCILMPGRQIIIPS